VDEFVPEESTKFYFAAADAVVLPYEANFSRGSGVLIECCRHLRPMIASATPYFSAFLARYPVRGQLCPREQCVFLTAMRSKEENDLFQKRQVQPPAGIYLRREFFEIVYGCTE
jgi:hypothetical protein